MEKKNKTTAWALVIVLLGLFISAVPAQTVCNANGNLIIFSNYDGGTLTVNVDQNIPNLKIGVCSYEGTMINLTGAFVGNVTGVCYAGYNGSNVHCTFSINTTINNAPGSATTSINIMPSVTLSNPNGYSSMICAYSCNNGSSQGGCNTVDQVEAYFLNYFPGSALYAHKVQYGCWTGTQSVSIGGNCCPPPVVFPGVVAGTQTVCSGEVPGSLSSVSSATVSSGAITYSWQSSITSPSSGFSNISGAAALTYTPPTALSQTTYFRRAASTVTNNVAYSNVLTVNVLPLPVINISGPSAVCGGASTTLTATGGTNYVWSTGGSGSSVVITPTVNSVITLTCFAANGCSTTTTKQILINQSPNVSAFSTNPNVCTGAAVTIQAFGAAGYTWQPGNVTGPTYTFIAAASGGYTVTGINSAGCLGSASLSVNVYPLPVVTINSSTSVCQGQSHVMNAGGAMVYIWMPGPLMGQTITVVPVSSAIYTVTGTDANGCQNNTTVSLTVLVNPTVSLNASRLVICRGETSKLTAGGAASYSWLPAGLPPNPTITVSPTLTITYSVVGTGTNGCTHTAARTLTVNACSGIGSYIPDEMVEVYPNPNNGEFTIRTGTGMTIEIINSSGQLVRTIRLDEKNNYNVLVTDLATGVYFIVTHTGDRLLKQSLIVR